MLLLVRHGRTELNAGGLLQGRVDPPLDQIGHRQAAALAALPELTGAARAVCSPLLRARQTAAGLGLDATVDERWTELDYGAWDGRPLTAVTAADWAAWRADPTWSPPGGESLAQLGRRVRAALAELAPQAAEEDVVVVTHVSPIKAAVAWALGVGDEVAWCIHLDPATVTRIAVRPTGTVLLSLNDGAHHRRR